MREKYAINITEILRNDLIIVLVNVDDDSDANLMDYLPSPREFHRYLL